MGRSASTKFQLSSQFFKWKFSSIPKKKNLFLYIGCNVWCHHFLSANKVMILIKLIAVVFHKNCYLIEYVNTLNM